jgi:hypothetical protein
LAQALQEIQSKFQGVAEVTGDKPFDKMMTTIKQGTGKQKTADRKEQQKQTQQRARDAFGNMFGGGNPADQLKIREQGVAEGQLNELDMFAPRTVYFKMADGKYIKADYRGSEGLSGHTANDNVTFTSMSWVPPNTAKTLGLDKFLAQGSNTNSGTVGQNAQGIVGTNSAGEGPLGNRTIDVVDFVNGKEDTVPSALKTQVMQWVQKNQSKSQTPAEGLDDPWGPQGNFAGDKPFDLGGVSMKTIQIGDTVKYLGQKAKVHAMSKDRKYSRITVLSDFGGTTKDVLTSDLQQLGRGMAEMAIRGPNDNPMIYGHQGDIGENKLVPIGEDLELKMAEAVLKLMENTLK